MSLSLHIFLLLLWGWPDPHGTVTGLGGRQVEKSMCLLGAKMGKKEWTRVPSKATLGVEAEARSPAGEGLAI